MTQTIKEVAGWLWEACSYDICLCKTLNDQDIVRNKWANRAAKVDAMGWPKTCDTCRWWEDRLLVFQKASCNYRARTDRYGDVGFCGPKFGCIHHEDKQQIKELTK